MPNSIQTSYCITCFALAFTVSEILTFNFFLENWGQGNAEQRSQWWHSMANIKRYKYPMTHFFPGTRRFRDINDYKCWPWKITPRSQSKTFVMIPFDGKYMTSYWIVIAMFTLSLTIYQIFANQVKCQASDLENEGQGRENGTCAIRLEMFDYI